MRCLVTTLVLLLVAALAGTGRGAAEEPKKPSAKPLVLSAVQLTSEYRADERAANRKYKDKDVLLDGVVVDVQQRPRDTTILSLKGSPGENLLEIKVACLFDDAAAVAKLTAGQKVKVRGTCRGVCGRVVVENCQIVEVVPQAAKGSK
jgi:hypothetical protein